jgi:hypothetical protein
MLLVRPGIEARQGGSQKRGYLNQQSRCYKLSTPLENQYSTKTQPEWLVTGSVG